MATRAKKTPPLTFAAARERLDEILAELERDTADVDQLAGRIKEAAELIRFCRERLAAARQEVASVVAELASEPAPGDGEDQRAEAPGPSVGPAGIADAGPGADSTPLSGDLPF